MSESPNGHRERLERLQERKRKEEKKENKRPELDIFFLFASPLSRLLPGVRLEGEEKRNPAILCNRGGWASVGRIPSAGYM